VNAKLLKPRSTKVDKAEKDAPKPNRLARR
jgi:hypothetical protein